MCNLIKSNRMFFWWELCKLPPQHWYLTDSLSRESCNPREQVAIAFAPFSNILWGAVCQSKFLRWLMMANIHYNRTTTLEKREKIIALWTSGRLKTGTICRRSWIISSNGIQYCEQIPLTRDVFVDLPFRLISMEK